MLTFVTTIILFASLALIATGYFIKKVIGKLILIAGYILFTTYWLLQIPYFIKVVDFVNAVFCSLALPFFAYISYHELLALKLKQEYKHLHFLAGWIFLAGLIYFCIEKIPTLAEWLIKVCAEQSVWLINIFGYNYYVGELAHYPELSFPVEGTTQHIHLILACTGIQSIAIFVGAIISVEASGKRKFCAFFATAPVIWILNLIRNAGIIYSDSLGLDANFVHNSIGKLGSLLALIVLAFVLFKLLPKVYTNIIALLELPKKKFKL